VRKPRRCREGSAEKQRSYPLVPQPRRVTRGVAVLFFPTFHLASPRGSAKAAGERGVAGSGTSRILSALNRTDFANDIPFAEVEMINEKSRPEVSRRESGRAISRAEYKSI